MAAITCSTQQFIEYHNTLMTQAKTQLETITGLTVEVFPKMSEAATKQVLPSRLPTARLVFAGSLYNNDPRRTTQLQVFVAEGTKAESLTLADNVVLYLDHFLYNDALFRIAKMVPLEDSCLAPSVTLLTFTIEDH